MQLPWREVRNFAKNDHTAAGPRLKGTQGRAAESWGQLFAAGGWTEGCHGSPCSGLAQLGQLEKQQQQLGSTIGNRDMQGRFLVVRNTLRILALCGVYFAGFQAIAKRRR
jgi:hypothetical protein